MVEKDKAGKSDGVEDVFKWMEGKCKEQKKVLEFTEARYEEVKRDYMSEEALYDAKADVRCARERLNAYVDIKAGVEKYMKKLRYQGE